MNFVTNHFSEHAFAWATTGILGLAALGAMAYMDLRHVQREEFLDTQQQIQIQRIEEQIEAIDSDISRLEFYNTYGSEANKQARQHVIREESKRKARKVMEWEKATGKNFPD